MTTPTISRDRIAPVYALPLRHSGLNPVEYHAIRASLPKATDAQLIDSLGLIARELARRGMAGIVADTAHEIALEAQSAVALTETAAALDATNKLGGVA
jgi:hypothetical protein